MAPHTVGWPGPQREPVMDFDAWRRYVFDHPEGDRDWYWPDDNELLPEVEADHLTRLFTDPMPAIGRYTDAQLNQGFWYLNSAAPPCPVSRLFHDSAPWMKRQAAILAIGDLYERLFAVRCTPHLSHLDELGASPLNSICYMWWDLLPIPFVPHGPHSPHGTDDDDVLAVFQQTLALDSVACQEAALHGLGHWRSAYPEFVHATIDRFLYARPGLRPELVRYAACARKGMIQ